METIYHEKQEGALCAQHCLNNLLQGSYYTAVDLAEISRNLDELEMSCMAAAGISTEDFQKFMEQPSENMDDSGMFSIQVILKALESFSLSLINMESQEADAKSAKAQPESCNAFICNFQSHWITIRKLGHQWFNLNSLLAFPELISDLHLSMYLTQLSLEGYTNFLVRGILPECEANQMLQFMEVTQPVKPSVMSLTSQGTLVALPPSPTDNQLADDDEAELHAAIALSLVSSSNSTPGSSTDTQATDTQTRQPAELTPEQLREKRLKRFDK